MILRPSPVRQRPPLTIPRLAFARPSPFAHLSRVCFSSVRGCPADIGRPSPGSPSLSTLSLDRLSSTTDPTPPPETETACRHPETASREPAARCQPETDPRQAEADADQPNPAFSQPQAGESRTGSDHTDSSPGQTDSSPRFQSQFAPNSKHWLTTSFDVTPSIAFQLKVPESDARSVSLTVTSPTLATRNTRLGTGTLDQIPTATSPPIPHQQRGVVQ